MLAPNCTCAVVLLIPPSFHLTCPFEKPVLIVCLVEGHIATARNVSGLFAFISQGGLVPHLLWALEEQLTMQRHLGVAPPKACYIQYIY